MSAQRTRELAYAKLNLFLQVGRPGPDGLHPLCSIFASVDLADEVHAEPSADAEDTVDCPGVDGPNLALAALAALRERVPGLPPIEVRIAKRIPVAAGLGGGSADAAAVLRAANRIAGRPLDARALREIAATLGSDVPSQVEPRHALVQGTGEIVEPVALPSLAAVLVPQSEGLETATVYSELDRMRGWRDELDPHGLRALTADACLDRAAPGAGANPPAGALALAAALDNDLQPATLSLRPELAGVLEDLRAAGALGALVTGSGPTCFGLFADPAAADRAAAEISGALVARLRAG